MGWRLRNLFLILFMSSNIFLLSCDNNIIDSNDNNREEAKETFNFAVSNINHTKLKLEGISGNVIINGESGSDSVFISGERIVRAKSKTAAEEYLHDLDVTVQALTNEVSVKTSQPNDSDNRNYTVNYSVTLPDNFEISATNINGSLTINSMKNFVSAVNLNGQIELNDIAGNTSAKIVNGKINGKIFIPSGGSLELTSTNGNIELAIPQDVSAEFSAVTVNGGVSTSNLSLSNAKSTSASIKGTLGDGQGTISLTTVIGKINVTGF